MSERLSKFINYLPNKIFGAESSDSDIEKFMRNITKVAVAVATLAITTFIIALIPSWVSEKISISELGPIGDFFGGILNPIFAFLGLMALLYTLRLNQHELNQATTQMTKSAKAAELQVKQDEMQHLLEIQAAAIDELLSAVFPVKHRKSGSSKERAIRVIITYKPKDYRLGVSQTHGTPAINTIRSVVRNLVQLEQVTFEHNRITKSDSTRRFYATKYLQIISHLDEHGYFASMAKQNKKLYLKMLHFASESDFGFKQSSLAVKLEELEELEELDNSATPELEVAKDK